MLLSNFIDENMKIVPKLGFGNNENLFGRIA